MGAIIRRNISIEIGNVGRKRQNCHKRIGSAIGIEVRENGIFIK